MSDRLHDQMPAIVVSVVTLLFHALTAQGYGYFRDELYYLACSQHLALGYVDHPPLIAVVTWLTRTLLGDSLYALRFFSAVAAAATVYLSAAIARELGGSRFAQTMAAVAAAVPPVYLAVFSVLSMNALDILLWAIAAWILVRILKGGDPRLWIAFGLVAGLGLQNKLSILFLGFGLVVGLVVTRDWRHLSSPWFWIGGILSLVIFAPHVWWQAANGWPTLEFMENARLNKNLPLSPQAFLGEQVMMMHPLTFPLWLAGLGFFLLARSGRPYRALGWTYLVVLLVMITQRAKPYYLSPIYPMLFAAGALVLERVASRPRWGWSKVAAPATLVVTGLVLAPLVKPILPVDTYVEYAKRLGQAPRTDERHELGRLPQFLADMHGWPELAATVAAAYQKLPPEDQARACIFAQNYGQAGAIDFFGPEHRLPKAISGHNSYFLWGPGDCDGEVMLVLADDRERVDALFERVEPGALFTCQDCMPYENNLTVWICRGAQISVSELWPRVKHFE
jgi:hypothetical protein